MTDHETSDLQSRIADLKAELNDLSLKLACTKRGATAVQERPGPQPAPTEPMQDDDDHQGSLRTLRDLMWQGRWGLAFHLARALEGQGVPGVDFQSSMIRDWALVSRADGRRADSTLRLVETLLNGNADPSLAPRLLRWATLIGSLRGVDPADVRGIAARFQVPDELPATSRWWGEYVEALATAPRSTTKWTPFPAHQSAAAEIDALVLCSEVEPVRLAASCLTMSIRSAMRHVRMLATADERFILNAELERSTSLTFAENGEVTATAADVERAVRTVAAAQPHGREVMIAPRTAASPTATGSVTNRPTIEAVIPTVGAVPATRNVSATVPPEPAPAAPANMEAVSPPMAPGLPPAEKPTNPRATDARRQAARERLQRYAERLAIQDSSEALFPPNADAAAARDDAGSSITGRPEVPAAPLAERGATRVPTIRREERRGIHETAVATAFGVETAPAVRSNEGTSISSLFFNPQSAIVAGLLVIAGAVVAGLGTGLLAKSSTQAAVQVEQPDDEASPEFTGDLPMMQ